MMDSIGQIFEIFFFIFLIFDNPFILLLFFFPLGLLQIGISEYERWKHKRERGHW